jgi:acetylornithine/LysW-gamma-L-lysine aminotransferase
MDEKEVVALEQQFAANIYARKNIVIERGSGALVWDKNGKEYIDCMSAYGVAVLGHCHPKIVEAIKHQAELLYSCHNSIYTEARSNFLSKLMAITPQGLKRAFLSNSGTESVEAAIKMARKSTRKTDIIAFVEGFHGKTMGALSATWNPRYRSSFEPLVPGFKHVPYGKTEGLNAAITEKTAAVIVEPIQGEGGIRVPPPTFLKELREICDRSNILLIFDEVQTGFGRTGKLFACEHSGVAPDILCLAKSIAGGLPLGVTVAREDVMGALKLGEHSSTFGGNPLVCAAASAAIDVMVGENLPERAATLGRHFMEKLEEMHQKYRIVREVRGKGLMIGVECRFDIYNILVGTQSRGAIILDAGRNILRFLPPLVITQEQLDKVATIVDTVVGEENAKLSQPPSQPPA